MRARKAFTLIELLVVVAIIGLLISVILPSLSRAREQAKAARCLSNLRVLGQGLVMYSTEFRDVLVPGRLPKIDDCNAYADILGGRKYRPTFAAMMSTAVNAPPFEDPQACKTTEDKFGQAGGRQDYSYDVYVCPSAAEWTDERNAAYGYNYQFLGNSRLFTDDVRSYKNWPVRLTQLRYPARTVAAGDCMGTAAFYSTNERMDYENNARDDARFGNEGFNLDPPRVDPIDGEMAGGQHEPKTRSAADPRHHGAANILWADSHAGRQTLAELGYQIEPDGAVGYEGDNTLWSGSGLDLPWIPGLDIADY